MTTKLITTPSVIPSTLISTKRGETIRIPLERLNNTIKLHIFSVDPFMLTSDEVELTIGAKFADWGLSGKPLEEYNPLRYHYRTWDEREGAPDGPMKVWGWVQAFKTRKEISLIPMVLRWCTAHGYHVVLSACDLCTRHAEADRDDYRSRGIVAEVEYGTAAFWEILALSQMYYGPDSE